MSKLVLEPTGDGTPLRMPEQPGKNVNGKEEREGSGLVEQVKVGAMEIWV